MAELQTLEARRALTLDFEKHAFKADHHSGRILYSVDHASISHCNFRFMYCVTSGEKERRFR